MAEPAAHRPEGVRVVTAHGPWGRRAFLRVPHLVYAGDPAWVPPLTLERALHLSRLNPARRHAEVRYWVALRGRRPVGRISAQVDRLHLETHRDATGFFGFLEAIDDPEVFAALTSAAETWLRSREMRRVLGPFSFSVNDECGLLVEGFEEPPMFLMPHGRPYYDARLREVGYDKAMDTVACLLDTRGDPPPVMVEAVRRARSRGVRVRPIQLDRLSEELDRLREVYNDAWSGNWGFQPFTREELANLGNALRLFVPPDFVQIAELEGETVAFIVLVPNVNEAIAGLGGRLLPGGWWRLIRRLRSRGIRTGRVPLMGVRRRLHRSPLAAELVFLLVDALRHPVEREGIHRIELSWILETNRPMRHIARSIGAPEYKRYRIYEKRL